jgi:hypothetical protein
LWHFRQASLGSLQNLRPPFNETLIRSPRTRYRRAPVNNSGNAQRLTKEQGLAQCCSSHALRLLELQWPRLTGSAQVRNISLIAPGLGKCLIDLNSAMWRIPPAISVSFAKIKHEPAPQTDEMRKKSRPATAAPPLFHPLKSRLITG